MKKEDVPFLEQMTKSLEDASVKLEAANRKKDYNEFRKTKKFMLEMQAKIEELIK